MVRQIYQMYNELGSLLKVTRTLNEQGIRQRSGYPWNPTTVSKILHNPFYHGTYLYFQRDESQGSSKTPRLRSKDEWVTIENHHPAIVTQQEQYKVVIELESKKRSNTDTAKTYERKNTHIFGGLCFCYNCGSQMQSSVDKERTNGFKPSLYVCSRRRRFNDCTNKYVTDITMGPFVLNYIANVIKLQNNFGKSTTLDMMEKKLLRGEQFKFVTGIEHQGLEEMYNLLRANLEGANRTEFESAMVSNTKDEKPNAEERDILLAEKRKKERALKRLVGLYVYEEDTISEKDFISQKKQLESAIEVIDKRIAEIDSLTSSSISITDEEFLAKATYFIMSNQLQDRRHINFNFFIQKTDKKVLKEFMKSIIQKIVIYDGKIMSIRFKNGIEHKFLYG